MDHLIAQFRTIRRAEIAMIELFQVRTVMPVLLGHKDVQITWFITFSKETSSPLWQRDRRLRSRRLEWARYAESRVDEFFTAGEANWFVDFLKAQDLPEGSTYIKKAELPISNQSMGLRAIPIGGGPDHVSFHRGNYWLPVTGYYDLRHYDPLPDRRSELARRRRSS